jgi:hypothetical protein
MMTSTVTYAQQTEGLGIEVDTANRPTTWFEINADLRTGRMGIWSLEARSTSRSFDEHHGHIVTWRIPALDADDLNELLAEIAPHVQVLVDAYDSEWNGHNNVALTEGNAAEAAREAIHALCDEDRLESVSMEYVIRAAEALGKAVEVAVDDLMAELISAHATTSSPLTITWDGFDEDVVITHPVHGAAPEPLSGLLTSAQEGGSGDISWIRGAFAEAVASAISEFEQADEDASDNDE